MRRRFALLSLLAFVGCAGVAQAQTGVVLVHGKQGSPESMERLAATLDQARFLTDRPEMCWSRARIYDRPYLECLADIDVAVGRLRARGARDIVVAGMSLGGNGVLAYGARHDDLKGIVAFAPAHAPEFISRRPEIAESLAKAQAMVAAGQSDTRASFNDVNTRDDTFAFSVSTTAAIYVSFFAPELPAVMPINAARLKAPLLLISGIRDETQRNARNIFGRAPSNALNRFVSVDANHIGTPAAGSAAMLNWLRELGGQ